MTFRRGNNIPALRLSGPQSKNLFNGVERTIERLDQRNVWAHCTNELNPGLPDILKVERCTHFAFTRFQRDLELTHDAKEGIWVLDKRMPPNPPQSGSASPSNTLGGGGGGAGQGGGGHASGQGGGASTHPPTPSKPKPEAGDEYRPINQMVRSTRRALRAAFLWVLCEAVRRSPRFRHTVSQVRATIARAREALRRFAVEAQKALLLALGWDPLACEFGVNEAVTLAGDLVQVGRFGAVAEPRVFERGGRKLTLWTFSSYDKPKWELWLFGRLSEDEQVAV